MVVGTTISASVLLFYDITISRYMEASERCQRAEETIEKETARLNYLQGIVDEKLEEVYMYNAA